MDHTIHDAESWIGQDLVGVDAQPVGTIKDIYVDAATDLPEWAAVKASGFGGGVNFVPLAEARPQDEGLRVPYSWATIQSAPSPKPDGELTQDEEAQLYDHYGLVYGASRSGSGLPEYEDDPIEVPVERVTPVQHTPPPAPNAMTRSEEELHVGTAAGPVGTARLRKHVVTEHVQTTVPVQREEVRLEREPITDANAGAAMDGPAISEEEHEVVLHEEEVVVEKRAVPKERVRMAKQLVTDEQTVTDEIRKEQIEVEGAEHARTR